MQKQHPLPCYFKVMFVCLFVFSELLLQNVLGILHLELPLLHAPNLVLQRCPWLFKTGKSWNHSWCPFSSVKYFYPPYLFPIKKKKIVLVDTLSFCISCKHSVLTLYYRKQQMYTKLESIRNPLYPYIRFFCFGFLFSLLCEHCLKQQAQNQACIEAACGCQHSNM